VAGTPPFWSDCMKVISDYIFLSEYFSFTDKPDNYSELIYVQPYDQLTLLSFASHPKNTLPVKVENISNGPVNGLVAQVVRALH
ncbi:hypothetical protein QNI16_38650, partial [Cytophagaceae bacterium YF14B1]